MLRNRFLEAATTKYLVLTVTLILAFVVGAFAIVLGLKLAELDKLTKFVDAVFKATAILLGVIWTLNRYYVGRTDSVRLRVDPDVTTVRSDESGSNSSVLLIFRLDVVNVGSVLIPGYQQSLEIESVTPSTEGTNYVSLYRWPFEGTCPGGPIEPGSWAALNDAISIPASVQAVRIYIEAELADGEKWTWHKTFDVSKGGGV